MQFSKHLIVVDYSFVRIAFGLVFPSVKVFQCIQLKNRFLVASISHQATVVQVCFLSVVFSLFVKRVALVARPDGEGRPGRGGGQAGDRGNH